MTEYLPKWFGFKHDTSFVYIVSPMHEQAVVRVMSEDQPLTAKNVRVDVLKCKVPETCLEIATLFQESGDKGSKPFTAVEVRTWTTSEGWGGWKTLGFYMITKESRGEDFKTEIPKDRRSKVEFTVRGGKDIRNSYAIDSKAPLYLLIEKLSQESAWKNERPVFVLQIP